MDGPDDDRAIIDLMGEPEADLTQLKTVVASGVLLDALDLYGRWWQFETWLRQLVHVELRARGGIRWSDAI